MATLVGKIEKASLIGWEFHEDQDKWITFVFPLWDRPHRERALRTVEKALNTELWFRTLTGTWEIDVEIFTQSLPSYLPGQEAASLQRLIGSSRAHIKIIPDYDDKYPPVLYGPNDKIPIWIKFAIDTDQLNDGINEIDTATTREKIQTIIKFDSDLDAFCLDYFPIVFKRFSGGMDRIAKVNILLQSTEPHEILGKLLMFCQSPHRSYECAVVDELRSMLSYTSSHQSTTTNTN